MTHKELIPHLNKYLADALLNDIEYRANFLNLSFQSEEYDITFSIDCPLKTRDKKINEIKDYLSSINRANGDIVVALPALHSSISSFNYEDESFEVCFQNLTTIIFDVKWNKDDDYYGYNFSIFVKKVNSNQFIGMEIESGNIASISSGVV